MNPLRGTETLGGNRAKYALSERAAIPAPEVTLGIGKLNINAIASNPKGIANILAKVLAHGFGLLGTHTADTFDFHIADWICGSRKGHGNARL